MTIVLLSDPPRLRFSIRVQPRSSRARVAGLHGEALKIQVKAPPVEGAANEEVIALLAKELAVPKSAVRLVSGEHTRSKGIEVACVDPHALRDRLLALASVDKTKPPD